MDAGPSVGTIYGMALTDAEIRAIVETAAGRPKQVQGAEGMVTQYSLSELIAAATYIANQNAESGQAAKGLGFIRLKPPDARNRISTST